VNYDTLEDFFGDIVGKAKRGLGISDSRLEKETGLSSAQISEIENYELVPEDSTIQTLAHALRLDGNKLIGIARGWLPAGGNEPYDTSELQIERVVLDAGMVVNVYILKCKKSGSGAIVDAGGQAEKILNKAEDMSVKPTHLFLTHGHGDHTGALRELKSATGAKVFCSEEDMGLLGSSKTLVDALVDDTWGERVGELSVTGAGLPGHTSGGFGYGTSGVFFSGDALFAGSLGGARGNAYSGQIEVVRKKVLSLSGDTRIFPGHGPITSVEQEIEHNPYFV